MSSPPPTVSLMIEESVWHEVVAFVATHPLEPPLQESLAMYQQIYVVARGLLGRVAGSAEIPNLPAPELHQEMVRLQTAYQGQVDRAVTLQARLEEAQGALVRAVGAAAPRREKVPDPPKYDGDRAALRPFITHLLLKLSSDHDLFPDEQKKLAYTIGRLEGPAFNHLLPYVRPGGVNLEDIAALVEVLETAFGDPDRMGSAERALENLRQGNRDFATYYAEFSRLVADVDWNSEPAVRHALKRGLSVELKQELVHHDLPESLNGFVRLCQKLDNRLRAFEAETRHRLPARSASRPTQVPVRTPTPVTNPPNTRPLQFPVSSSPNSPAPMDISSNRRRLTPEERARRIAEGLCLYCGGAGHIAVQCPNTRFQGGNLLRAAAATFSPTEELSPAALSKND
jgi:Retrotransposon gag protein